MADGRLPTSLWVSAQVRLCSRRGIPATVVRHGDDERGQVLVKLNRLELGCCVYARRTDPDGRAVWYAAIGPEPAAEADADADVEREYRRDPDLWVLEIEDREGRRPFEETALF